MHGEHASSFHRESVCQAPGAPTPSLPSSILQIVQCLCTVYSVQITAYSIQCTVQCAVQYTVQCPVYSDVYCEQCTLSRIYSGSPKIPPSLCLVCHSVTILSAVYTVFNMVTVHSTLSACVQSTVHCERYTVHCVHSTPHCVHIVEFLVCHSVSIVSGHSAMDIRQNTVTTNNYSELYTAQYTLHTTHCALHTAQFTLHTAYCTLQNLYSTLTLHTLHLSLNTPPSTLYTANCTLLAEH